MLVKSIIGILSVGRDGNKGYLLFFGVGHGGIAGQMPFQNLILKPKLIGFFLVVLGVFNLGVLVGDKGHFIYLASFCINCLMNYYY